MNEVTEELRRQMIAEAAYFRAQQRGFSDGDPLADWLAAEREIDAKIATRDTGVRAFEERLATVNERLKAFRKRVADVTHEAREEWEEDIAKLAKQRDRLRERLKQARDESGHAAERARLKAEEAWDDIAILLERLGRRKPGADSPDGSRKHSRPRQ